MTPCVFYDSMKKLPTTATEYLLSLIHQLGSQTSMEWQEPGHYRAIFQNLFKQKWYGGLIFCCFELCIVIDPTQGVDRISLELMVCDDPRHSFPVYPCNLQLLSDQTVYLNSSSIVVDETLPELVLRGSPFQSAHLAIAEIIISSLHAHDSIS